MIQLAVHTRALAEAEAKLNVLENKLKAEKSARKAALKQLSGEFGNWKGEATEEGMRGRIPLILQVLKAVKLFKGRWNIGYFSDGWDMGEIDYVYGTLISSNGQSMPCVLTFEVKTTYHPESVRQVVRNRDFVRAHLTDQRIGLPKVKGWEWSPEHVIPVLLGRRFAGSNVQAAILAEAQRNGVIVVTCHRNELDVWGAENGNSEVGDDFVVHLHKWPTIESAPATS